MLRCLDHGSNREIALLTLILCNLVRHAVIVDLPETTGQDHSIQNRIYPRIYVSQFVFEAPWLPTRLAKPSVCQDTGSPGSIPRQKSQVESHQRA